MSYCENTMSIEHIKKKKGEDENVFLEEFPDGELLFYAVP
jgi:hypothetical protein